MTQITRAARPFLVLAVGFILSACGGGGVGDDGSSLSFITWNGSENGSIVLLADSQEVQFLTGDDLYADDTDYTNVTVNGATVYLNGTEFGTVTLAPGQNGGSVATLVCTSTGTLATFSNGVLGCS